MTAGREGNVPAELGLAINVARLPQDGLSLRHEASEAERAAVAARFDILGVERLVADLVATRWQKDGIVVRGRLEGAVRQTDIVTLEPLERSIDEDVELFFVPEGSRLAKPVAANDEDEIELDPAEDAPETFHGDRIDLGEPLVQLFGLALDPYPRGADVAFEERREGEKEPSPFAVLAKLRPRDG